MSTVGPRMAALKNKEDASLPSYRYGKRTIARKFRPDIALGISAGSDIEEVQTKTGVIIIFSFISAVLLTVAYGHISGDENKQERELVIGAFSISWFVFVSFIFLLFNQTRLLHIFFFITVLIISGYTYEKFSNNPVGNKEAQHLLVAACVFSGAALLLLLAFYFSSMGSEEILELKTENKLRKRKEEHDKEINEAKKEATRKLKIELGIVKATTPADELLRNNDSAYKMRLDISERAIENFYNKGKGGGGGGGGGGSKKEQNKKKQERMLDLLTREEDE